MSADPNEAADPDAASTDPDAASADPDAASADDRARSDTGDDAGRATAPVASRDVSPTSEDRTRLAALVPPADRVRGALPGVAVAGFALVASGGVLGLVATVIVGLLWAVATPVYAATAAALLFVALERTGPFFATDPVPLEALAAVGVAWLVLSPVVRTDRSVGTVGATAVGGVALGAVAAAGLQYGSLPIAAGALVVATAIGGYAIHRYSVVRLAYRDPQ